MFWGYFSGASGKGLVYSGKRIRVQLMRTLIKRIPFQLLMVRYALISSIILICILCKMELFDMLLEQHKLSFRVGGLRWFFGHPFHLILIQLRHAGTG
jgi:hypothetical protein